MSVFVFKVRERGVLASHQAPVSASPHSYHVFGDAGVVQKMLLERNPPLLGVHLGHNPASPHANVEVSDLLIEDTPLQSRFDLFVPDRFGVEMQIIPETSGDHDFPTLAKLVMKLGWYSQPLLVIQSPFKVVAYRHLLLFNVLVVFVFRIRWHLAVFTDNHCDYIITHCYPPQPTFV